MRVLHVINSLGKGGAEKLISELLPIHKENGLDVSVLVLTRQQSVYGKALLDSGIDVDYLSNETNLKSYKVFKLLKEYFKKYQFDLVHVHLFPSQYFVPFTTSSPTVFTEHSTTSNRRKKVFKPLENWILSKYQQYVFVSREAKKSFIDFIGFENDSMDVIHNGINLNKLREVKKSNIRKELELSDSDMVLTMVSSFKPEKDQITLIKAMINFPEYKLLLLGEGKTLQQTQELVYKLSLQNRVHFLGFREDANEIIKSSNLVIQSSRAEGFGLSVLEGMALGIPVLVSDIDGLKEVVDDPRYRFETGNFEDLSRNINEILKPNNYETAIQYCIEQSKNFSIESTALQYQQLYERLLACIL